LIFLNTNIQINIPRKKSRGKQWKQYLKDKSVAFTTISAFKLFLGAELSAKRENNLKTIQNLVQQFPVLPLSIKSSYLAGKIYSNLQKQGKMIGLNDIYITGIVVEYNAELATENIMHFQQIKELRIIEL